jgi:hypothetical protein
MKKQLNEEFKRMQKLAGLINEFEDLSKGNNYLTSYNEVDSREVAKDLFKTKPYFKSRLPLYQNDEPLTDYQINSLIDTFASNERDISASMSTGPLSIEKIQGKWKSVDIDDLTNNFINFVKGVSENWEEWEFHDANKNNYSDFDWPESDLKNL